MKKRETRKSEEKMRVSIVEFPKMKETQSVHIYSMRVFQNISEESLEKNQIDIFPKLKYDFLTHDCVFCTVFCILSLELQTNILKEKTAMIMNCAQYTGPCRCGRTHTLETRKVVVDYGALSHFEE